MEMDTPELQTAKGRQEEDVKQFSVFMENKVGRLLDIVKVFAQARVHVVALSILDTADAAIVRLVADDPDKARVLFQEHGLASPKSPSSSSNSPAAPPTSRPSSPPSSRPSATSTPA